MESCGGSQVNTVCTLLLRMEHENEGETWLKGEVLLDPDRELPELRLMEFSHGSKGLYNLKPILNYISNSLKIAFLLVGYRLSMEVFWSWSGPRKSARALCLYHSCLNRIIVLL